MENNYSQAGNNYYANLNRLQRYLERQQAGYAFACYPQRQLIARINQQLIDLLAEKQIRASELFLNRKSESSFLSQMQAAKADVLIVNNLGEFIEEIDSFDEASNRSLLQEINFAREELFALGKPILFWTNQKTNSFISNQAADLYTQRSINTVFFDEIEMDTVPVTEVKTAFGEHFVGTDTKPSN